MILLSTLCITIVGYSAFAECRSAQELPTLLNLPSPDVEEKVRIEPSIITKLESMVEEKEFIMSTLDSKRSENLDNRVEGIGTEKIISSRGNGEHHMLRRSNEVEKSSPSELSQTIAKSSDDKDLAPSKWKKALDTFFALIQNAKRLIVSYSLPAMRFAKQHIIRMLSPLPSKIYRHPVLRSAAASFTWSWIGDKLFTFLTRLQSIPQ